jgi:hypothetical protein
MLSGDCHERLAVRELGDRPHPARRAALVNAEALVERRDRNGPLVIQ